MNVLSNFVLRVVFDNLIHSNYAFSAKLQFNKKSDPCCLSDPGQYGLLTMFQYKSLHDIVLLKASYLKLNLQAVIFAIYA